MFNKDDQEKKVETLMAPSKKQEVIPFHQETKQEGGSGKKKVLSKKQKTENGEIYSHVFYKC
jgi:kinectin